MTPDEARGEFDPEVVYCNTATLGLPPRRTIAALESTLADWRSGRSDAVGFDDAVERARAAFAGLVGVDALSVAIGSVVSPFVGLVAAALPPGSEVLVAEGEFTSVSFPFLAQAGVASGCVRRPWDRLADAVGAGTTLVAVSAVQSSDGTLADLSAIRGRDHRSRRPDARGRSPRPPAGCPWMPGGFDITVCGGYKWLLAPRGTAFMVVDAGGGGAAGSARRRLVRRCRPLGQHLRNPAAAGRRRPPLRHLAGVALVGGAGRASLDLLASVDAAALQTHCVGLANRFRQGAGLPPGDSAIVSLTVTPDAAARLAAANVVASVRAGRLRLSFHLVNGPDDADVVADALTGCVLG